MKTNTTFLAGLLLLLASPLALSAEIGTGTPTPTQSAEIGTGTPTQNAEIGTGIPTSDAEIGTGSTVDAIALWWERLVSGG